ncbi:MurR/RpiR family transcriptional regulator [Helcococcus kunzii]|uniref:MurR/RpiR family transcriptional regulator n=1 Tax=Helcococcus kunzii TaxID=40091 RepID=UPI0024AE68CB|nr:MurR/RpiR family transcriptional regulator [Helcococcus kunzii]
MKKGSAIVSIVDNYDNFTEIEKLIADYFIKNKHKEDFSIKSIKDKLYVSEASLTRFSQKCGFKGYREFIYRYEEEFLDGISDSCLNVQEVLNIYNQILTMFPSYINDEQIDKISRLIIESNNVLFVGIGSSGMVAKEMQSRLTRLGILVEAIDFPDEMRMRAVFQEEGSLVIGISLSGIKESVLFSLHQSKQNGAKTVLVTSNDKDNFPYVDEVVLIPTLNNLRSGNVISPQFPILIFMDFCYNKILKNSYRENLHKKTIDALEENK